MQILQEEPWAMAASRRGGVPVLRGDLSSVLHLQEQLYLRKDFN
jgi:hypothetical protein